MATRPARHAALPAACIVAGAAQCGCSTSAGDRSAPARQDPVLACTLSPEELEVRRDELVTGLLDQAETRTPLERGYRLTFASQPGLLDRIAGIVESERACCSFLRFTITVAPAQGPITLELTGPPGTRELLDSL